MIVVREKEELSREKRNVRNQVRIGNNSLVVVQANWFVPTGRGEPIPIVRIRILDFKKARGVSKAESTYET
jgi:hypothetical protein